MKNKLQAPFPYFGGKSRIAHIVWQALGQPKHYMEPFFGSGAVLLARPEYDPTKHIETIVDSDGYVCNVWRALQANPDEVAKWCDWPVNHADLTARRIKLLAEQEKLLQNLCADDEYYNAKLAGYWVWAANCWIGSGLTFINAIPHLSCQGVGVHKLSQRPHLSNTGSGVHKLSQIPHLGNTGSGVQDPYNPNLYIWFRELSERMRQVRVVCGDWSRVCGGNWQDNMGIVGIFFDPPYSNQANRRKQIYHCDSESVAHDVREWCLVRGKIESYRIGLAGYYEEHEELLQHGWTVQRWTTGGGYGNLGKGKNENRKREALFFSPYCLNQKEVI